VHVFSFGFASGLDDSDARGQLRERRSGEGRTTRRLDPDCQVDRVLAIKAIDG
jgi:hypothetical protein